jgi:hypothetical protein
MEYLERLLKAREVLNESREVLEWEDENICAVKRFSKISSEYLNSLINKKN